MAELSEDFKKIDVFLTFVRTIDTFRDCYDIYDLFKIDRNANYPDIENKINEFVELYSGINAPKFRELGRTISGKAEIIKRILKNHKREYNGYLLENHPKVIKLREQFHILTHYDEPPTLDSKERQILINEGTKTGLEEREVITLIDNWVRDGGIREIDGKDKKGGFDVLLNTTYYEVLGVPEDADYAQIKKIYDDEYRKYVNASASKKLEARVRYEKVLDAWECLRDNTKRRTYDEELRRKREEGLTSEGDPKLEIVNEDGNERRSFEFKNMRLGTTSSVTIIAKNGGGGTLDAKIKTSHPWLIVNTNKIHQSKLPQGITITVNPKKDSSKNHFGCHDKGIIEITYQKGSYIESEKVFVEFNIEAPETDLSRFRNGLTISGLIIGGLFGFFVYVLPFPYNLNLSPGMSQNIVEIAGLVALFGVVIIGGMLGYKDEGGSTALSYGCGTLVVGFIILSILESYFPHAFSTVVWALTYGSLANISSTHIRKALWQGDKKIPIVAGVGAVVLMIAIILMGATLSVPKMSTSSKVQSTVIVSARKANIRARPSTSSKIIAKANKGTRLAALETNRNWYKVKFKLNSREKVGWIYKSLVGSKDTATTSTQKETRKEPTRKPSTKELKEKTVVKKLSTKETKTTAKYVPPKPPPSPGIDVSSYSLDFGEVKVRKYGDKFSGRNIRQSVYISNTGDADLVINKVTSPKSPFEIKTNECTKKIKPKRRCKIRIAFSPATNFQINEWTTDIDANEYMSKIEVDTNYKNVTISLFGKAVYVQAPVKNYRKTGHESRPKQNSWEKARKSVTYEDN